MPGVLGVAGMIFQKLEIVLGNEKSIEQEPRSCAGLVRPHDKAYQMAEVPRAVPTKIFLPTVFAAPSLRKAVRSLTAPKLAGADRFALGRSFEFAAWLSLHSLVGSRH